MGVGHGVPASAHCLHDFRGNFSGTTSGDIALSVALSDARQSRESKRLVQALERSAVATLTLQVLASEHDVADTVRNGSADGGVVIRDNGSRFGGLVKPKDRRRWSSLRYPGDRGGNPHGGASGCVF